MNSQKEINKKKESVTKKRSRKMLDNLISNFNVDGNFFALCYALFNVARIDSERDLFAIKIYE